MHCKACGEDVIQEKTAAGTKILLNPEPVPLGMLYISSVDGTVKPWTEHIGRSVKRYESHSYNCPNSESVEANGET